MADILVIDDEAPIRDNIARFLRLEGHGVREAADGLAGWAQAQRQCPDFVLCDVMMPGLTGLQLLERFQADPQLRGVPFVFLSASAEPEQLERALTQGATAYVTKPFNLARLREVLAAHLPPAAP